MYSKFVDDITERASHPFDLVSGDCFNRAVEKANASFEGKEVLGKTWREIDVGEDDEYYQYIRITLRTRSL